MARRSAFWLRLLVLLVDLGMAALAYYAAYELRTRVPIPTRLYLAPFAVYTHQLLIHALSVGVTFFALRLYHTSPGGSRIDLFYRILSAVSIATLLATALSFLSLRTDQGLTRGLIIYHWGLSAILITIGRILTGWLAELVRRRNPERLLLVGTGEIARMILQKTLQSRLGYRVVGFVDGAEGPAEVAGFPVLGTQAELGRVVQEHHVDEVIIALSDASHEDLMSLVAVCEAGRGTGTPALRSRIASSMPSAGSTVVRPTRSTTSPLRKMAFMPARTSTGAGSARSSATCAAARRATSRSPTGAATNGRPPARPPAIVTPLPARRPRGSVALRDRTRA